MFDTWYCQRCGYKLPPYLMANTANVPHCPACHAFHWATTPKPTASGASAPLAALTEHPCESCGRLREQLDALADVLTRVLEWPVPGRHTVESWTLSQNLAREARAALGVVGPPTNEVSGLSAALQAADDLLRRLSEWDALNLLPVEAPYGDAPYWQREIAKTRAELAAVGRFPSPPAQEETP